MSAGPAVEARRESTHGHRRRVRLITEGNYPEAIGGVTRWCDLLLCGLTDIDWEVFALGVTEGRHSRCGVRIRYPDAPDRSWLVEESPVGFRPVENLARALFGADTDPRALLEALVEVRRGATGTSPSVAAIRTDGARAAEVRRVLIDSAPGELRDGPEPITPGATRAGIELLNSVVTAATADLRPCDVTLSATAGIAAVPGAVERLCNGTPLVVVEHGIYVGEAYSRTEASSVDDWTRWMVRSSAANLARGAYEAASAVVGVSEANVAASRKLGADPASSVCIPNGIQAPVDPPAVPGSCEVGTVARVDPLKGIDIFIEVAALVAQRFPEATFTHAGPVEPSQTDYARRCSDLTETAGLGTRLSFLGAHQDPPSLLERLHVQVIPSRSEGLPFSLLEGMAAGRPIVATAVGGIPETLGDAGLVVGPGDIGAVADAVSTLLADPREARRLGMLAHRAVSERYPLRAMLEGYRGLFDSLHALGAVA